MNASFILNSHNQFRFFFACKGLKGLLPKQSYTFIRTFHNSVTLKQVKSQSQTIQNVFDRNTKRLQRERAALFEEVQVYDYLKEEVGYRLADRIYDIKRQFPKVVDLGCSRGYVSRHAEAEFIEELIMTDHSELLMSQCVCNDPKVKTQKIVCDEEKLEGVFEPESVDLVISNLVLHWVNKLPDCFEEIMKMLKVDGVFLASLFGNDTLFELRSSLQLAELERKGGIAPHVSPFAKPTDIGGLLMRAGFVMQTIDTDEIIIRYPSMFELMDDLKGMGESNAAWNRSLHLSRDTLLAASVIYDKLYADTKKEADDEEGIPATFQIIYFIGWKPDPKNPLPPPKDPTMVSLRDYYKIDTLSSEGPKKIKLDD